MFIQSFFHTAAYPNKINLDLYNTLSNFIIQSEGIILKPGDGIIHFCLNRVLLPNTVGTGGDSHKRFPIEISFPAGSSLIAFAATTGFIAFTCSRISISGIYRNNTTKGNTLRDLVHAIPYYAAKQDLLTINKKNKKIFFLETS